MKVSEVLARVDAHYEDSRALAAGYPDLQALAREGHATVSYMLLGAFAGVAGLLDSCAESTLEFDLSMDELVLRASEIHPTKAKRKRKPKPTPTPA